jgi:hypothetical protein
MKGLFKSKPRTPADVVRQTRELLIYLDLHSASRGADAKREEKVRPNSGRPPLPSSDPLSPAHGFGSDRAMSAENCFIHFSIWPDLWSVLLFSMKA